MQHLLAEANSISMNDIMALTVPDCGSRNAKSCERYRARVALLAPAVAERRAATQAQIQAHLLKAE